MRTESVCCERASHARLTCKGCLRLRALLRCASLLMSGGAGECARSVREMAWAPCSNEFMDFTLARILADIFWAGKTLT